MEKLTRGRVVHYFNAGNGACQTGITVDVDVDEGRPIANLVGWDGDGDQFKRLGVPLAAAPSIEDVENSFHLAGACPWGH